MNTSLNILEIKNNYFKWLKEQPLSLNEEEQIKTSLEHFLSWLKTQNDQNLNVENFDNYLSLLKTRSYTKTDIDLISNSLKKFAKFLNEADLDKYDLAQKFEVSTKFQNSNNLGQESIFDQFSKKLSKDKLTQNTIKNYIYDCEQFFAWLNNYEKGIEINI
ncbi:hypothetical protein GYA19_02405 [Candidatus Beckwithbacteria bacterium]|nr:hypothetical protein [Candidatus Beckwithbacteria bacterium]